jgi:exonuclease V gamma subunit
LRGSKGDALDLLRSTGLLPPGRAGVIRVQRLLRESEDLAKAVQTAREGPRAEPVELDLVIETDLGSTRLGGAVGDLWQSGLVMYAPRPLTGTAVLGAWIRHLALLAADAMPGLPETRLFGVKSRREVERMTLAAPPDGAMRHLGELIDLYRLGNEIPLPLMPDVSYKHALKMLTRNKRQGPAADLRTEWERSRYSRDIAVVTAFRGNDLFTWEPVPGAGFDSLSVRVFQPILEALLK